MKLMITDLTHSESQRLFPDRTEDRGWLILSDDGSIHPCIGCFGCWVKTPGACLIRDRYGDMGKYLSRCDELAVVSRCCYGGPSPFVKNVLDRSIPYIHPCFTLRAGEMHHRRRYENRFTLAVSFYGPDLTPGERETARGWVEAVALNFDCAVGGVEFRGEVGA